MSTDQAAPLDPGSGPDTAARRQTHYGISGRQALPDPQARAIWHVVAEARAGRFDALAAHVELVVAGYTASEADVIVQEIVERLAERQPDEGERRWP